MKIKITIFAFFALLATFSLISVAYSNQASDSQTDDWSSLKLKVSTSNQDYLLGEVVRLNFEIVNEGSKKIILPGCSTVKGGYLRIHIAYENQPFKEYFGSGSRWQLDGGCGDAVSLEPGQSFKTNTTVLWNVKPEVLHLNEDAAKRVAEGRIMNDYALPKSGVYFIKAVLRLPGETRPTIESEGVQVVINEPVEDDLEVWSQIKDKGDIAYFIQQGGTPTYQDEKAEKLLKEVEQIVRKYPNSYLASQMKQKLEKFRMDEEKRKEMLEKARIKPKN